MIHGTGVTVMHETERGVHPMSPQLPVRSGLGLKPQHFAEIIETQPDVGFFEIHAENYMVDGGPFHHFLERIGQHYPLSLHGVGMSLGGEDALDAMHLDRLCKLIQRYRPAAFSEHLAWSSHGGIFFNDLLPLPYNGTTLQRICDRVNQVQDRLNVRMLLENPATYVEFEASTMSEGLFMSEVVQRTGCGLLLDVNNVHVSCTNHRRDPWDAINALPLHAVEEVHLAGFACDTDGAGDTLLIDNHGSLVDPWVWQLYVRLIHQIGGVPTLIEWDNDVPPFPVLLAQARQVDRILADAPLIDVGAMDAVA